MIKCIIAATTVLWSVPILAQSQEDYERLFTPAERVLAVKSLGEAQNAATHMSRDEIRQVFKIHEPTCRRARVLGLDFANGVAKDLKFGLWQQVMLIHICIVRQFGSADQQAGIIALMR